MMIQRWDTVNEHDFTAKLEELQRAGYREASGGAELVAGSYRWHSEKVGGAWLEGYTLEWVSTTQEIAAWEETAVRLQIDAAHREAFFLAAESLLASSPHSLHSRLAVFVPPSLAPLGL